jgi:hypothetical protein
MYRKYKYYMRLATLPKSRDDRASRVHTYNFVQPFLGFLDVIAHASRRRRKMH